MSGLTMSGSPTSTMGPNSLNPGGAVELTESSGRALKLQTDAPHLVSMGGGRLSTSVTLHPIPQGRVTMGSGPGVDIPVQGTGVQPVHCHIENNEGVVTIYPLSENLSIDGAKVTGPTRLSQGVMLTIGRSNYMRFNHPAEAKLMKSVLPNPRISMAPIQFEVETNHQSSKTNKKPPVAPRKNSRESLSDSSGDEPPSTFMTKLSKFEYLAAQNLKSSVSISPKVFSSNLVTVNIPAKDVLGKAPPDLHSLTKNLPQSALNYSDLNYNEKQKNKTPDRQIFGRKSPQYVNVALSEQKSINNRVIMYEGDPRNDMSRNDMSRNDMSRNDMPRNDIPRNDCMSKSDCLPKNDCITKTQNLTYEHQHFNELNNMNSMNNTTTTNQLNKTVNLNCNVQVPSPSYNRNPTFFRSVTPSPVSLSNNANLNQRLSGSAGDLHGKVGVSGSLEDRVKRKNEAELRRNQAQVDRIKEQEIEKAEQARLEEILNMCAEYEKSQTEKNNKLTPNRIKTNGSLPRDKRQGISPGLMNGSPNHLTPSPNHSNDQIFRFEQDHLVNVANKQNNHSYENVAVSNAHNTHTYYENVELKTLENFVSHDGRSHDGRNYDGRSHDGRNLDGRSFDGRSHDGRSHDGRSHDVRSHDGRSHDGRSHDGRSFDGRSLDGRIQDVKSHDGRSHDGRSHDGRSHDGRSHDGRSHDGRSHDGRSHDGRNYDGRSPVCGSPYEGVTMTPNNIPHVHQSPRTRIKTFVTPKDPSPKDTTEMIESKFAFLNAEHNLLLNKSRETHSLLESYSPTDNLQITSTPVRKISPAQQQPINHQQFSQHQQFNQQLNQHQKIDQHQQVNQHFNQHQQGNQHLNQHQQVNQHLNQHQEVNQHLNQHQQANQHQQLNHQKFSVQYQTTDQHHPSDQLNYSKNLENYENVALSFSVFPNNLSMNGEVKHTDFKHADFKHTDTKQREITHVEIQQIETKVESTETKLMSAETKTPEVQSRTDPKSMTDPKATHTIITQAKTDTVPSKLRTAPTNLGTIPTNLGSTPINLGSTPINQGSTPINLGSTPTNLGTTPTNLRTPTHQATTPATPGTPPTKTPESNQTPKQTELSIPKDKMEFDRKRLEALKTEKKEKLQGIARIKRQMAEIEIQGEELQRELEMERALIVGEYKSKQTEVEKLEARKEKLVKRAHKIDEKMEDCKMRQSEHQNECKDKLQKAQEHMQKIEKDLADTPKASPDYDNTFEDYLVAQEILDNERKNFEDLEFHYLEEEADWLASREELQREILDLSKKMEESTQQINDLDAQTQLASKINAEEYKKIDQQKLELVKRIEEIRNQIKVVDEELMTYSVQESEPELSSDSDSDKKEQELIDELSNFSMRNMENVYVDNMSCSVMEYHSKNVHEHEHNMTQSFNEKMLQEKTILDMGLGPKFPSQDDIDRICKVTSNAPMNIDEGRGSLGKKTIESLREIEENRKLHLAQQGSQVIEQERRRVLALKQRVQHEVRTKWAQRRQDCSSYASTGSEDTQASIIGNEDMDKKLDSSSSPIQNDSTYDQLRTESEGADSPRPLSETSDVSLDMGGTLGRRRAKPLADKHRPLTRYLPIRDSELDLRLHIESAGHQVVLCPHVLINTTSCRGFLHKKGSKLNGWSRRWFVFDRNKRALIYYADKSEKKPRGGAYFQSIEEVYLDHANSVKSPNPQLTFIVKTHQRTYYLMAPSPEAMRIWIDVIFTGAEGYQEFQQGT